jgi:hypothetical protein
MGAIGLRAKDNADLTGQSLDEAVDIAVWTFGPWRVSRI